MDSENLSSLIRLSVSDGQKTDSSKVVSVIGIYKAGVFSSMSQPKHMFWVLKSTASVRQYF